MHATDTHNDKPGFFSKIFGHGDDAAAATTPSTDPVAGQVTQPTVVEPTVPEAPVEPTVSAEPELQAGSMSDVHAMPGGTTEALDLSASQVSQPEAPETEVAPTDEDNTFQMPDIKIESNPTDPVVPVTVPSEPQEGDAKEEILFDSTQPIAEPAAEAPGEVPATESTPITETETPAAEPATDVEPPAPPVEEGQAWQASQQDASPSGDAEAPQAELAGAQTQVNSILATHPDLTTDRTDGVDPAKVEEKSPVEPIPAESPLEKVDPTPAATEETSGNDAERQAAVVRLTHHIDDLEAGLQKVRDELEALKK